MISEENSESSPNFGWETTTLGLQTWRLTYVDELVCHRNDEIDDTEIGQRQQRDCYRCKSANPFIDYPGLEGYIWGEWRLWILSLAMTIICESIWR